MDNEYLYEDTVYGDVSVEEAVRRRREKARRMKRRREKQLLLLKRRIIAACCGVVLLGLLIFGAVSGVKAIRDVIGSRIAGNNVDEVAAGNDDASAGQRDIYKVKYDYPTISNKYTEITSSSVRIPYVALLSVEDNNIIAGREPDSKIYPASMTKVMTLLVAVENIEDLDNSYYTFKFDELNKLYLEEASVAGYLVDEKVSARDMLYGLVLPSGADAAVGLANLVAGSETEFAKLMNKKCDELGLKNTHFENTSGLYNDNQYTTPVEMAIIMRAAMDNPVCAKVLSTYQYDSTPTDKHMEGIKLTSTMFSRMYGNEVEGVSIQAGKTGYVYESGHCLVSYAEKDGKHYVCVLAQGTNKWHCIFDSFDIYTNYLP